MANKSKAINLINKLGGAVDEDVIEITRYEKRICIDAPEGFMWVYNDCECICLNWHSGPAEEFWDEVVDAVEYGIQPINEPPHWARKEKQI